MSTSEKIGVSVKVFVYSPHRLIYESLISIIAQRHEVVDEDRAEVAVKDLSSYSFPYPAPPRPSTLALISCRDHEITATEVLRIGYRGYLGIDDGEARLELALQALLRGENWAERHVIAGLFNQRGAPSLTQRENEIYALAVTGVSNRTIASELGLSVNTVKVHMSNLLHKLEVKTRKELIVSAAYRVGFGSAALKKMPDRD